MAVIGLLILINPIRYRRALWVSFFFLGLHTDQPVSAQTDRGTCHWLSSHQQPTAFELKLTDEVELLPKHRLNDNITINKIIVNRYNVFDQNNPDEQNSLFEWLNAIHFITKEQVVRDTILFEEGQPYQLVNQEESERLLRASNYIYDARIRPLRLCNNKMDIEVTTRDLWSLTPSLSVTRSGGITKNRLALRDSNFLGTGKQITLARNNAAQRTEYLVRYHDPNILGTRRNTTIELSDNSDGYRQFISFQLPFYSLSSIASYGFEFNNEKRVDSIYHQTILTSEFEHRLQESSVFLGYSKGYQHKQSFRWRYGFSFREDIFLATALHHTMDQPPIARKLVYPWLGIELLENRYIKLENYHSIKRTEDINLGRYFTASIGYSNQSISQDIDRLVLKAKYKNAFKFTQHLFDINASLNSYWQPKKNKIDDLLASLTSNYYNFHANDWVFYSSLTLNYSKNLSRHHQLFLGGDSGLRGFPSRYIDADKTALLSIEERYYSNLYWFSLIRVGAAIYVDIGTAWGNAQYPSLKRDSDNQWLTNLGIGLRFTPTRADANHVIHFDLAFPLNGNDAIDDMQLLIKVKQSF